MVEQYDNSVTLWEFPEKLTHYSLELDIQQSREWKAKCLYFWILFRIHNSIRDHDNNMMKIY